MAVGDLAGSVHRYLPELAVRPATEVTADKDVWVACASGYRASIAGGLLERAGYQPVVLIEGGTGDVVAALSHSRTQHTAD